MIVLSPGTRIHSTPKQGFMDNDYGTFDAFDTTTDDTTADYTTDLWGDNVGDNSEDVGTDDNLYYLSDGTEVPINELEQGYLRQSDYTRKTQELAQQRADLAEAEDLMFALQNDPKATLEALQRHLVGEAEELEDLDPLELEVREHRQFIEQQRSQELQYEVENELADLEEEYGEFDWDEVLEFAIDREIPDLEAALLLYDSELEREAARLEANGQILAAKRGQPPVARGMSRPQGQVSQSTPINSVMDAWEAAKRELGYE